MTVSSAAAAEDLAGSPVRWPSLPPDCEGRLSVYHASRIAGLTDVRL
ncbi:hypothetical protein ACFVU3_36295 [Streptomyces sp. NPDC058052]